MGQGRSQTRLCALRGTACARPRWHPASRRPCPAMAFHATLPRGRPRGRHTEWPGPGPARGRVAVGHRALCVSHTALRTSLPPPPVQLRARPALSPLKTQRRGGKRGGGVGVSSNGAHAPRQQAHHSGSVTMWGSAPSSFTPNLCAVQTGCGSHALLIHQFAPSTRWRRDSEMFI